MKAPPKLIIFTSVDGALLHPRTRSCAAALPALRAAQARGVPIALCSSRTQGELEELQRKLGIHDPFIVENGGAILIPGDYFPQRIKGTVKENGMVEIELGESYQRLVRVLHRINRELPFEVRGFSDLSACELAKQAKMTLPEARRAKARAFDEPFLLASDNPLDLLQLQNKIAEAGLLLTRRGRFFHLHSDANKGVAVRILTALYRHFYRRIRTVGLGDDLNDLPLLSAVDVPIVMRAPRYSWEEAWLQGLKNLRMAEATGPRGWNEEVLKILDEIPAQRSTATPIQTARAGKGAGG